jgi:hypothetical protein
MRTDSVGYGSCFSTYYSYSKARSSGEEIIAYFSWYDSHRIKNDANSNSSILVYVFVVATPSGQDVRVPGYRTEMYCLLWGTNWIYIYYAEESGHPLWSSGQSSWLEIQRSGFDFRPYQIFWEVVGLERGPLSLVSTIEELLEKKSSGSGLESREYGRRDSSRWPRGTPYPQRLSLTSPTSGGHSV